MTPLLAASVTGHIHIVEYLIANDDLVSRKERIDALELLGATFVDKKRDMLGAFKLWKRAMEDRYDLDGNLVCPKVVMSSPIAAYENTVEVSSLDRLEDIISDPDEMRMQALLVRERILGPAHPDTSYYIRYRGAVYADMGHFERCITLWMYALDMQQKMLEPLSPMTQSSLLSFAELFSYMMSEGRNRNNQNNSNQRRSPPVGGVNNNGDNAHQNDARGVSPPGAPPAAAAGAAAAAGLPGAPNHSSSNPPNHPPVNFCDIMTVFEKAVTEVRLGQEALSPSNNGNASPPEKDITYFNRTLVIILHLICLLTKLLPMLNKEQTHQVKKTVFNFLKVGARGRSGSTPLHLACSRDTSAVGRYPICQFPSVDVISLLLECGADINARDVDDNLPLHIAALNKPVKKEVVTTLLDAGGHLDSVNGDDKTFTCLLKGQPVHEVVPVMK